MKGKLSAWSPPGEADERGRGIKPERKGKENLMARIGKGVFLDGLMIFKLEAVLQEQRVGGGYIGRGYRAGVGVFDSQ